MISSEISLRPGYEQLLNEISSLIDKKNLDEINKKRKEKEELIIKSLEIILNFKRFYN